MLQCAFSGKHEGTLIELQADLTVISVNEYISYVSEMMLTAHLVQFRVKMSGQRTGELDGVHRSLVPTDLTQ